MSIEPVGAIRTKFGPWIAVFIAALASIALASPLALGKDVLRVGFTGSDIPLTSGQPSQGQEGMLTVGFNVYDALIAWDLSVTDRPAPLRPGLAEAWSIDAKDPKKWTFQLRRGVRFHDGSEFNADAVIWNLEKLLNKDAPQYDAKQAGQGAGRIPSVAKWRKVDTYTVEIITNEPDVFLPYQLVWFLISSPAQYEKVGRNWDAFALHPSGTGPFKVETVVPRQRLVMVRNGNYWDKQRVPKIERLELVPIPEASTRTTALLSNQVDWIEAPAPDTIARLRQAGKQITSNKYPHVWVIIFDTTKGSAFEDVRVRQAANLAVDRKGLVQLLGGLANEASGLVPRESRWFGSPTFKVRYDPEAAKALLAKAGYGPQKPVVATILTSSSGSGQMLPLPMVEFVQQNLAAVGIKLELKVIDWNNLLTRWRQGALHEANADNDGIQFNFNTQDPFNGLIRFMDSRLAPPKGVNYSSFSDPNIDRLIDQLKQTADPKQQDEILGKLHSFMVDQAFYLFVVHDAGARALGANVKNFRQSQSWYQDFTQLTVE
jgi:ABC-type transport system substrate-binding protein